jgi:DNA-binding NtrC family response regulator
MEIKKILIVEDEAVIRRLCNRLLLKPGRELRLVDGIQAALAAVDEFEPHLVISDLRLPDGYGVDVVLHFKKKFPDRQAIIITGSLTPDEHLHQLEDLNVACIYKPFELSALEEAVNKNLGEA